MVRPDPTRVRAAQIAGEISGMRNMLRAGDRDLEARHRAEWPELWARIDELINLAGLNEAWRGPA
jgi:hypothetical protein